MSGPALDHRPSITTCDEELRTLRFESRRCSTTLGAIRGERRTYRQRHTPHRGRDRRDTTCDTKLTSTAAAVATMTITVDTEAAGSRHG